jgi:hypothetical protein
MTEDVLQQEQPDDQPAKAEVDGSIWTRDRAADILARPLHPSTLVGSWCSVWADGQILELGLVVGEPDPGRRYLVQFYDGGSVEQMTPTHQEHFRVDDMDDWHFYDTQEEMVAAWFKHGLQ